MKSLHSLQDLNVLLAEAGKATAGTGRPDPDRQEKIPMYRRPEDTSFIVTGPMMYLIGVEKRHFANHTPDITDIYDRCDQDKNARVIRNLCILRTALEQNYSRISAIFKTDTKNLRSIPELIPASALEQLEKDGITIYKANPNCVEYVIMINKLISERIGTVRSLFPEWLCWEYIRSLFIMPRGSKKEGVLLEGKRYNFDWNRYPYHCYINWHGTENTNILYSDKRFVTLLYEEHGQRFENMKLLVDYGAVLREDLASFLSRNSRTIVVVDCENSDPIKFTAAMTGLSPALQEKIGDIILFDSEYTTPIWKKLCQSAELGRFPVRHVTVPRIYEHKSQVDMTLAAETCREVYQEGADSVILVSSDSDYWALIQSLRNVDFLVMLEHDKSGRKITDILDSGDYHYCYLDDCCTGAAYSLKTATLCDELLKKINEKYSFNLMNLFEETVQDSWITMTDKEKKNFCNRYLKSMVHEVSKDGILSFAFAE